MKMSIFGLVAVALGFTVILPATNIQLQAGATSETVESGAQVLGTVGGWVGLLFLAGAVIVLAGWSFGGDW